MHYFVDAFKFIGRDGELPGKPHFPTLIYYSFGTMKITVIAMAIALAIALPIGIWLGNIGRALPSLAVLAIGVAFLGLGLKNVLLALVILAVPPIITNAHLGIDQVDRDLTDAARGMGMTGWQILWRLELPLGLPLLMAGVRTAALFVVSTTTISALTGYSDSLGEIINNEASYQLSGVLGAAICIAALAMIIELVLAYIQRTVTPAALRSPGLAVGQ
jgi:osmoprotectant transport system permease protein